VRLYDDLEQVAGVDTIIECSAEPSVLAGLDSSAKYLIDTNFSGVVNCLELARSTKAGFVFISTSRVYPFSVINSLRYKEAKTRFVLDKKQSVAGVSEKGFDEGLSLDGLRSLYGATKFSAELILQEYIHLYGIKGVINRCSVISGPGQMAKVDQGVLAFWIAAHVYKKNLDYIGFGGQGKQVRDFLHVRDLFGLIDLQIKHLNKINGNVYNVGGGEKNSLSLSELTALCSGITGNKINIGAVKKDRYADVKLYINDYSKVKKELGWYPKIEVAEIASDVYQWIKQNKERLKNIII
jgi:CDP-paratose 2-epimerase